MRPLVRALLPGSRAVWVGAFAVLIVFLVFSARFLAARTASLTGTNSVGVASVIVKAESGQTVCVRDLKVPPRTGRIAVSMGALTPRRGARVDAWLEVDGRRTPLQGSGLPSGLAFYELRSPELASSTGRAASVCVRPQRVDLDFGGAFVQRLPGAEMTELDGEPIGQGDVSVRYLRALGDTPTVLESLPQALRRATAFESAGGSLLLWVAIPALLLVGYFVARTTATASGIAIGRLALAAAGLAFIHGACWAVLLHPFHGADESEHFAYAQHLAATSEQPDRVAVSARSAYSSSQLRLMEAVHHNSTILNPTSRPRWDREWERRYELAARGANDEDGGGGSESATGHSPLYYGVIGLPYRVFGDAVSLPGTLLMMRLLNALLASGIAALTVLTAAKVFGSRHRRVAWAAGVVVALQPVFGSVAGAVNNDTAVNLASASLLYLLVTVWSDGLTWRRAILVALAAVCLPLAKITGFGILPAVVPALALIAARHGVAPTLRWASASAAVAATTGVLWIAALSPLLGGDSGTFYNVHPAGPVAASAATGDPITIVDRGNYFVQTFLPDLPFAEGAWNLPGAGPIERSPLFTIYIERGYGLLGWRSLALGPDLLRAIGLAVALGWGLALVAAVRRRRAWRTWLGGVVILATALLSALAFISYAYATNDVRTEAGEQGRYAFTAMVPLGVLFAGSLFAFPDRFRAAAAGVLTSAAAALALLVWLNALRGWFL